MEKFLKKHYRIIVVAIMTFFTIVSVLNAKNDSATFDEVAHIPAAYTYVTLHDTRLNPEHPPLIKDLAGIPLLFLHLNFDSTQAFWTGDLPNLWDEGQWAAGRHLLYEAGNNPDQIIFWARIPIVILSIIFGLFLFKWGKEIGGVSAGLFILTLYAFDPNILGHNHYVTTDLGVAAFLTFSFYYFLKFVKDPSWKNVFSGGLFLGLLLVSKYSSIVAIPIYGLVLIVYPLVKKNRDGENNAKYRFKNFGLYLGKGLVAFAIAAIVIWGVLKINTYRMPTDVFDKTIDFFFSANDPNAKASFTNKMLHSLNQSSITSPWSHYIFGPAWTFKRVSGGNGAYFLGQVGNGFTWYFPVVFLIKETIPFLLLSLFALIYTFKQSIVTMIKSKWKKSFANFLRFSVSWYAMFVFIILYAFLSIRGGLNIGFRHLFPILPFAYLLITKKTFDFIKNQHIVTKRTIHIILGILLVWVIVEPMFNYPGYVSYFNETVGGSKNGYHFVTDSNTDWGQDLKRLKIYLNEHPEIDKIHVDYFGGGDISYYIGDKYIQWYDSKRPIESGWYAISTNFLMGSIYDKKNTSETNYSWTLRYQPVSEIGNSILIYHIPKQPLEE